MTFVPIKSLHILLYLLPSAVCYNLCSHATTTGNFLCHHLTNVHLVHCHLLTTLCIYLQIPFSKFYLAAKGRIQDKQEKIELTKISYVGITLADAYNGPFNLEVDYIGLYYDSNHQQDFAYEMYEVPSYMLY